MPGVLTIDWGQCTAWAFARPGEPPKWGTHVLRHKSPMREDGGGEIGLAFEGLLIALIHEYGPDDVVFEAPYIPRQARKGEEDPPPYNPETLLSAGGYKRQLETICCRLGIRCWQLDGRSAVKALTGRGSFSGKTWAARREAKKTAMIEACWARGWKAITEDEADTLGMLVLAEERLYPHAARLRKRVLKPIKGPLFQNVVA